jgi:hypothetical protein
VALKDASVDCIFAPADAFVEFISAATIRGQQSRGAKEGCKYKMGDFTRGIILSLVDGFCRIIRDARNTRDAIPRSRNKLNDLVAAVLIVVRL